MSHDGRDRRCCNCDALLTERPPVKDYALIRCGRSRCKTLNLVGFGQPTREAFLVVERGHEETFVLEAGIRRRVAV